MARYLSEALLRTAIGQGRSVEQFLGGFDSVSGPAIRYAVIMPQAGIFELLVYEVLDPGDPSYLDIYSFGAAALDVVDGDAACHESHSTLEGALQAVVAGLGGSSERWVNRGVCQDEYADYLARK